MILLTVFSHSCLPKKTNMTEVPIHVGWSTLQVENECKKLSLSFVFENREFLERSGAADFDQVSLGDITGRYSLLQRIDQRENRRIHAYVGSDGKILIIKMHPENLP